MEIKRLEFERVSVEINEAFVDDDGSIKERKRIVMMPAGNCIDDGKKSDEIQEDGDRDVQTHS